MSEIERYLDELFDRLAGTGAAGRRLLAETEEHLRDAAADGVAAGLDEARAEAEAVRRFGSPGAIAAQLRRAHRRPIPAAVSGIWLLAGIGAGVLAAAYLATAVSIAILMRMHPETVPACSSDATFVGGCSTTETALAASLTAGVAALAVAAVILASRWVARRRLGLAKPGRRFPYLAGAVLVFLGPAVFLATMDSVGTDTLGVPSGPGPQLPLFVAAAAVLAGLGVTAWGMVRALR
jgi:hypothetical protein